MSWMKYDPLGRPIIASINSVSTTTATIQTQIELAQVTLSSSGAFDVDLSSGDALLCTHLEILCLLRSTVSATSDAVYLFWNNDTTVSNYRRHRVGGANTAIGGGTSIVDLDNSPFTGVASANSSPSNYFSYLKITVPDFRSTSKHKIAWCEYGGINATTEGRTGVIAHQWTITTPTAINRVQIRTDNHPTDLFTSGSAIWVFGTRNLTVLTNVTIS